MRKPHRVLVIAVLLPFVAGCFGVLPAPVPPPTERQRTDVRGVVLTDADGTEERVEFDEVYQVNWTETSLFIVGSLVENEGIPPVDATREYEIEDLSAVLTRQIDAGKSSIIVGALVVGAIAALSLYFTGQTDDNTVLHISPR